ncbi:hypothetical protein HYALB_00004222 [Hymenoscyphus albidus]|uniref:Zn(2)-C6 fungal-type domain-containing protein n=1 Tax=Hymenoscyphus albidus TaxID=595503 RepID=A0A9N9QDK5_9HELO|nr:hypothetical protein HYALB_00004222 [Hymenoscyphus albidus]
MVMSDTMHSSSSSSALRPRQRTFTSCTECRRRKQKCNQAKDRPCSNCARRYPPPVCTYQSSSSSDHVLDSRDADRNAVRSNQPSRSNAPLDPSMTPASQYYGGHSAAVISPGGQYPYNTTPDYNTPSPSARSDGRYYSGNSSSHQIDNSSTSGDYYPTTAGYYPADIGHSSADTSQDYSYLAPSDQDQWLTGSNADVFVGTGTNEYYYVDDAEASRSARN